jgi:5,10-methylenetetrahydrofolate reductase
VDEIILEILPPPQKWNSEQRDSYCCSVTQVIKNQNIRYVGVPEVVNESRETERTVAYQHKIDNIEFIEQLKEYAPDLIPIPYKICVRATKSNFQEWIKQIYEKGYRHIVLVGGENHKIEYPGYTVLEAARHIKEQFPLMKMGGIAIFTRHGEAKRILEKSQAGIDFFFSQIVIEPFNMKQILHNLSKLCKEHKRGLPKIYVSLSLASQPKDIEFMKWLGVEFPTAVLDYFTCEEERQTLEERSIETVEMILDEIFHFMKNEGFDIGFNIEHIMYNNLYLSQKLHENIKQRIASA